MRAPNDRPRFFLEFEGQSIIIGDVGTALEDDLVADRVREKTLELLSPGHQQVWSGLTVAETDTTIIKNRSSALIAGSSSLERLLRSLDIDTLLIAGTKTNIIPSYAELEGTVRTYDADVARACLEAIERTARAEAAAWGAPQPQIEHFDHLPVTDNDPHVTERARAALVAELGEDMVRVFEPEGGSEDFSVLPDAWGVPYTYWGFGAFDAQEWARAEAEGTTDAFPSNHSAHFAPVLARRPVGLTLQVDVGNEVFDAKFGNLHPLFARP